MSASPSETPAGQQKADERLARRREAIRRLASAAAAPAVIGAMALASPRVARAE